MKNVKLLLKNLVIACLALLLYSSCKDEAVDEQVKTPAKLEEQLATDKHFIAVAELNQVLIDQYQDEIRKLNEAQKSRYFRQLDSLSQQPATEANEQTVLTLLGFADRAAYVSWKKHLLRESALLNDNYPALAAMNADKKILIFAEANKRSINQSARIAGNCEEAFANCNGQAKWNLMLATTACVAAVFTPVVGPAVGVACEGAAIGVHYYASKECYRQYNNCPQDE